MNESVLIDNEFRNLIPALEQDDYTELEESIKKHGNIVPITIWKDHGIIVDGHNRYDLCIKYNKMLKTPIELPFSDRNSVKIWIIDNQLARRNLAKFSKIVLIKTREELTLQFMAKVNKKEAGELYHKNSPKVVQNSEQPNPMDKKVIGQIAKKAGVSHDTVWKVDKILESAKPEQIGRLNNGKATINEVFVEIRREKVKNDIKQTPKWPSGKYRIIYADPPWKYSNSQSTEFVEQSDHYPLMTVDEVIQKCPVSDISLENSILFLWVTSPILEESFKVINAWGFKYKACFVWDKVKHVMGHYNSVRHEFLLIAVKGSCQPDNIELFDSVQTIERNGHSEKPEEFRKIIDTLYPYGPRVELFTRKIVEGWDNFGNQLQPTNKLS